MVSTLRFSIKLNSNDLILGTYEDVSCRLDMLSNHSEQDFKNICESSLCGTDFIKNLDQYYHELEANIEYNDTLKQISQIEDFKKIHEITVEETIRDDYGGETPWKYTYSFLTKKAERIDVKKENIEESESVKVLFDDDLEYIKTILKEAGIQFEGKIDEEESCFYVKKDLGNKIAEALNKAGRMATIEAFDEKDEDEEENNDPTMWLDIGKKEFMSWLGIKTIKGVKSEIVKEFFEDFYDYEFFDKGDGDGILQLWSGTTGKYVKLNKKELSVEYLESILQEVNS